MSDWLASEQKEGRSRETNDGSDRNTKQKERRQLNGRKKRGKRGSILDRQVTPLQCVQWHRACPMLGPS